MGNYSKNQTEAIQSFGKPVRVFAGAGSGKTTVLVERFFYAVTKLGIDPERILAITFTDKAANEMKKRLLEKCAASEFTELRRKIESASISTIHSFCAKLLKENPIEAGVDPYFQILGEGEAEILAGEVLDRLFEAESDNAAWVRFLGDTDEESVRHAFGNLYETYRAIGGDESIFKLQDFSKEAKTVQTAMGRGVKALAALDAELGERFKAILSLLEVKSPDWKTLEEVSAIAQGIHKKGRYKEAIEEIRDQIDVWRRAQIQSLAEPQKKEFLRMFLRFKESYEAEKRKRAMYDFEDLLFASYRLLSDPAPEKKEVLERLQKHFACIFVDECQDTNPIQAEIIRKISRKDNWFIVGDAYQSIYGFRHAAPEIFEAFTTEGGLKPKDIPLFENYRSRAEILDFTNKLFPQIFSSTPPPALKAVKKFSVKKESCVEWLYTAVDKKAKKPMDELRIVEARALAQRIQKLVDSKFLIEDKGQARPMEHRDIAILLKTTTASAFYEKELSDLSIPYFTMKSRGFYEKPEVKDLVNFLMILENPNTDIALAGVLRSALVGITEDGLFWMARDAKKEDRRRPLASALGRVEAISGLSDSDREKLLKFREFWSYLRSKKNSFRLSEVIEMILSKTSYEAKTLALPEGRQKVANGRKLWEMAERLEAQGIFGIADFVHYLKNLSEKEMFAPEARIQAEQANVVTISTIHAAKGLEFPCVVIADMGSIPRKNTRGAFICRKESGFGMKLRNPLSGEWEADASYYVANQALEKKEAEEDERLLYVAMTRAKEHLILSGVFSSEGGASWMSRVGAVIDTGGFAIQSFQSQEMPAGISKSAPKIKEAGLDKKFFSELDQRIDFPLRPYEQVQDVTVTDLLVESLKGKEGVMPPEEEPETILFSGEEEEAATPRNEYGTLFHRAMEFLVKTRPKTVSKAWTREFSKALTASEQKEMAESIEHFWNGPWGLEIRRAPHVYPELPFIYKTRYGILKGQIDLVLESADKKKGWMILDYKTNRLVSSEKSHVASDYEFQLALYALIFKKLYGRPPARGVLYFSSIDETAEFEYSAKHFDDFETKLEAVYGQRVGGV